MAMIFDTHAHYDDSAFDEDRETLLASLPEHGIGAVVNVSASVESLEKTLELTRKYPFVYGAVGIHPDDADRLTPQVLERLGELAQEEKILAVGEIGLDYYWHRELEEHQLQQQVFRAQLEIARTHQMPFMVHSRDAAEDTLDIVREYMREGMYGGIIHCFSYSWEIAQQYLSMGLFLGIGGVVTFANAKKIKEVVEKAPLEQIVLETDCPYLAPVPFRGRRNSSLNLPYVVKAIAQIKGVSEEYVTQITLENAVQLLGLEAK